MLNRSGRSRCIHENRIDYYEVLLPDEPVHVVKKKRLKKVKKTTMEVPEVFNYKQSTESLSDEDTTVCEETFTTESGSLTVKQHALVRTGMFFYNIVSFISGLSCRY